MKKKQNRTSVPAICEGCGISFMAVLYQVKIGYGRFCGRLCQRRHQAAKNSAALKSHLTRSERVLMWKKSVGKAVILAHRLTYEAISSGRLKRLPCEVCGKEKTDAHHDDYSKPLEVRFLCRKHHLEFHRKQKSPASYIQGSNQ